MSTGNLEHFTGDKSDLINEIKQAAGLVVVDFFADWCGPCKSLGRVLPHIAEQFPTVKFLKANVDENQQLSEDYEISTIPAIKFFKKGVKEDPGMPISSIIGANVPLIRDNIEALK